MDCLQYVLIWDTCIVYLATRQWFKTCEKMHLKINNLIVPHSLAYFNDTEVKVGVPGWNFQVNLSRVPEVPKKILGAIGLYRPTSAEAYFFLPFYLLKMGFSAKSRAMFWDPRRPKICFWHHFPIRYYVYLEVMESNPFITLWILGGQVCSWDEYFFNFSSKINYWGLISLQKLIKISGSIAVTLTQCCRSL